VFRPGNGCKSDLTPKLQETLPFLSLPMHVWFESLLQGYFFIKKIAKNALWA
jgi:hypothetical protein